MYCTYLCSVIIDNYKFGNWCAGRLEPNHIFALFGHLQIHCKKVYRFSSPQPGSHWPNSPCQWIIFLFPARESKARGIPAGDGKIDNLFLQCIYCIFCNYCLYTVQVCTIFLIIFKSNVLNSFINIQGWNASIRCKTYTVKINYMLKQ